MHIMLTGSLFVSLQANGSYFYYIEVKKVKRVLCLLVFILFAATSCSVNKEIVNNVPEREANEIIVFLDNYKIRAEKTPAKGGDGFGGGEEVNLWNIAVPENSMMKAMALLTQNGLPRRQGTNLLKLFAKQGLMTSEREEQIRYQAGLEEQIANMIRKIDGVIDADIQLSFPTNEPVNLGNANAVPAGRLTAAVFVKHQGIADDPNAFLTSKIKRLVAGSVYGLDANDVTVISDRARFAEALSSPVLEAGSATKEWTQIWSLVLSRQSVAKFQVLFFSLILLSIIFIFSTFWLIWKVYPLLQKEGGFASLFELMPFGTKKEPPVEASEGENERS